MNRPSFIEKKDKLDKALENVKDSPIKAPTTNPLMLGVMSVAAISQCTGNLLAKTLALPKKLNVPILKDISSQLKNVLCGKQEKTTAKKYIEQQQKNEHDHFNQFNVINKALTELPELGKLQTVTNKGWKRMPTRPFFFGLIGGFYQNKKNGKSYVKFPHGLEGKKFGPEVIAHEMMHPIVGRYTGLNKEQSPLEEKHYKGMDLKEMHAKTKEKKESARQLDMLYMLVEDLLEKPEYAKHFRTIKLTMMKKLRDKFIAEGLKPSKALRKASHVVSYPASGYPLTNIDEFLVGSMTNPPFQAFLKKTKIRRTTPAIDEVKEQSIHQHLLDIMNHIEEKEVHIGLDYSSVDNLNFIEDKSYEVSAFFDMLDKEEKELTRKKKAV